MNLRKLYIALVNKAQAENGLPHSVKDKISGYEIHHIFPRSWGASDHPDNLVRFTLKQHYVAHHILARWLGGGMWDAFHLMSHCGRYKVTCRNFETIRMNASERMKGNDFGKFNKGKKLTTEHRKKLSEWQFGKVVSEETKQRIREALLGRQLSEETKKKMSQSRMGLNTGSKRSEESKQLMREKALNRAKMQCPHCKLVHTVNVIKRYHLDKCKHKPL